MIEKIFTAIILIPVLIYSFVLVGVTNAFGWLFNTFRQPVEYGFYYPIENMVEISIVYISADENGGAALDEIRNVDDREQFIKDFRAVECLPKFGEPSTENVLDNLDGPTKIIRILYDNGDFELIGHNGESRCKQGESPIPYYENFYEINEEQFNQLVEKYSVSG